MTKKKTEQLEELIVKTIKNLIKPCEICGQLKYTNDMVGIKTEEDGYHDSEPQWQFYCPKDKPKYDRIVKDYFYDNDETENNIIIKYYLDDIEVNEKGTIIDSRVVNKQ